MNHHYLFLNTRIALRKYLSRSLSRSEIEKLFLCSGFQPLEQPKRKKVELVDQFFSQKDWSNRNSCEDFFGLIGTVLSDLKQKWRLDVPTGRPLREQFTIILNELRKEGADFSKNGKVTWNHDLKIRLNRPQGSLGSEIRNLNAEGRLPQSIDFLFVTALSEEYQILNTVLAMKTKKIEECANGVMIFRHKSGTIATASSFHKGAVAMGIFITPLLHELRPQKVILFGIAATVKPSECSLGDVPCASQVLSLEDIAVEDGLEFRTQGFQTDIDVRRWIELLSSSSERYTRWQAECEKVIGEVVKRMNHLGFRKSKIKIPNKIKKPHIFVGNVAGGPFLLRDEDFRNSLVGLSKGSNLKINNPAHPQLLSIEMESHGFMRAALAAGIPASVLKGISDDGDQRKAEVERTTGGFFRIFACSNAVLAFLHSLYFSEAGIG